MIIVDRLLAEQHEIGLLTLDERTQRARDDERLRRRGSLDQQRTIRAHCEARAQLLLRLGVADGGYSHV